MAMNNQTGNAVADTRDFAITETNEGVGNSY